MIDRASFLLGALAAAAAPVASPAPTPTEYPWDVCRLSKILPYDRPLDLRMQALDAKDFHLMDYRGRWVLLNVFATWCGPCNHEQPALVAAAEKYASRGVSIVGLNAHEPDDDVRAYRKKYGITYPIAMDRRGGFTLALEDGYNGDANVVFPVTFFINPYGYLSCMVQGSMTADEIDYRIARKLADVAPFPTPTASP